MVLESIRRRCFHGALSGVVLEDGEGAGPNGNMNPSSSFQPMALISRARKMPAPLPGRGGKGRKGRRRAAADGGCT
eukprot:9061253-Pyramimonas_sp.AAC.1